MDGVVTALILGVGVSDYSPESEGELNYSLTSFDSGGGWVGWTAAKNLKHNYSPNTPWNKMLGCGRRHKTAVSLCRGEFSVQSTGWPLVLLYSFG